MHKVISRCGEDTLPPGCVRAQPTPALEIEKLPPEIWIVIARTLGTQRSARNLYQSCRFFRSLLTPIVDERIHITNFSTFTNSEEFSRFCSATQMQHVRHLTVDIDDIASTYGFSSSATKGDYYKSFNDRLAHCLNLMPNLVTFVYGKMPDTYERGDLFSGTCNKVPLFNETLTQLRGHRHLRNLSITMHTNAYFDIPQCFQRHGQHWTSYVNCDLVLDVGGFRNLTSLYLGNLNREQSNISTLADELASTLAASPGLRALTFGLYNTTPTSRFIPMLCKSYKTAGGKPLPLRSLHIGHGRLLIPSGANSTYPAVSDISQLCDLTGVEEVSFFGDLRFPLYVEDSWDIPFLQPADFAWAIRRFSGVRLDENMMSFINTIGNDLTLPPHFMSEMLFAVWEYWTEPLEKLHLDKCKSNYWPKVLSIESFKSIHAKAGVRRRIIRKLYQWTGLERLHLPVDLRLRDDRILAFGLVCQLKDNLRVLSLGTERYFTVIGDQRESDMCIYSKSLKTQKKTLHATARIPLMRKLYCPNEKLNFAKKLSAVGNLRFLAVCNIFFEIHKAVVKQARRRAFELAWLHRVTFTGRENTDFYEVLFSNRPV